jgi:undecaprenyl pyrophosphate phosphatase UppP
MIRCCKQSVTIPGAGPIPSHQTSPVKQNQTEKEKKTAAQVCVCVCVCVCVALHAPSSVFATLVKMVSVAIVCMAEGLVFSDVPGATPKKPACLHNVHRTRKREQ